MRVYLRRRQSATVPLLLIHLLTWRAGGANTETKFPNIKRPASDGIILEEVIISGRGNNTQIIANTMTKEPSQLGHEILSFLSKRDTTEQHLTSDLDVSESRKAKTVHVENDDDDLESLKHVMAKYEPQKITSKVAKRKIVDASIDIHDTRVTNGGKNSESTKDLENTYHEVLRNISRGISQPDNVGLTSSSHLSEATMNFKRIPTREATIRTATGDETEQPSRSNIDPASSLSALKKKKLLLQKYTQLNRTNATSHRVSPDGGSRLGKSVTDINDSATSKEHLHVENENPKLRNRPSAESSLSTPDPTKKSGNRRGWNAKGSSSPIPSPATVLQWNNHVFNASNLNEKQPSFQSAFDSLYLPLKYSKVPRPFSAVEPMRLPDATDTAISIATPHKKPSSIPAGITHQVIHSTNTVLPLVLPTDLFSVPPVRHYVPIKRANVEFRPDRIHTATASSFVKTNANAIGTTKMPAIAANDRQSPGYYVTTERRTVVAPTSFATTHISGQSSSPRILQRRKEPQDVSSKTGLALGVSYDAPNNAKSDLDANPGVALYNKFARLYSIPTANVLHVQQMITQDYEKVKQPSLPAQQASDLPYATLKPILKPISLRLQPTVSTKPLAPYFDSSLLLSQQPGGRDLAGGEEDVGDKTEGDVADDKSALRGYRTQVNHELYNAGEGLKTTSAVGHERKQDRDEDLYHQRSQDEDDGKDGRSRNAWNNKNSEDDEKDVDETRDGDYVNTREDQDEDDDEDNRSRYDKFQYYRDDPERYDDEDSSRDEHERNVKRKPADGSRYSDHEDHADDEEYHTGRHEQRGSARDSHYDEKSPGSGKEEREDERTVSQDESVSRLVEGQRGPYGKYQKKWNNNDDKYYSHLGSPTDSSRQAQQKREEYSESNPKQVREEYDQRVQDHYRDLRQKEDRTKEEPDHVHGETQEHAHKHEKHHEGDHKFEDSEGGEHEEEHHGHKGEKGDKGYKVWHEHEKSEKGHHDKQHSSNEYDEKEGEEKKHNEEGGYHEHHQHDEKGEKSAEFGEKGEHQKGHSTKGEHSVHKKDEYEKKTEFFDEFHEDGGTEKHDEHHHEHESKKGGHGKKAHHDIEDHEEKHDKEHKYEKGGHHHEHKGHKAHEGHEHHYDHGHKHDEKGGHEHGKKWSFKKGDDDDGHKHNR